MKTVPPRVRARMLLRSFAVQGSWNYETLIGAGFCYTILPALRIIYGANSAELRRAAARHTELFNSHPYFATVAAGAVTRLEAEGAEPQTIQRFKSALRGSLGSIGDRLIWSAWRPMAMLAAFVFLLAGASWWVAVTVFLVIYNALHLWLRVFTLRIGLDSGLEVGRRLRDAPLQALNERSSQIASALVGVVVVLAAAPTAGDALGLGASVTAIFLGFWLGLQMRKVMIALLVLLVTSSLILGIFGYGA